MIFHPNNQESYTEHRRFCRLFDPVSQDIRKDDSRTLRVFANCNPTYVSRVTHYASQSNAQSLTAGPFYQYNRTKIMRVLERTRR